MSAFTRDQVQKLTPEQQEAFGTLEAQRIRSRQQLLQRARRNSMGVGTALLMGFVNALAGLCLSFPRALPVAIIAAIGFTAFLAGRLNRRIDMLMELLEQDMEKGTKTNQSGDDHAP
jgi:hypothetical protein